MSRAFPRLWRFWWITASSRQPPQRTERRRGWGLRTCLTNLSSSSSRTAPSLGRDDYFDKYSEENPPIFYSNNILFDPWSFLTINSPLNQGRGEEQDAEVHTVQHLQGGETVIKVIYLIYTEIISENRSIFQRLLCFVPRPANFEEYYFSVWLLGCAGGC